MKLKTFQTLLTVGILFVLSSSCATVINTKTTQTKVFVNEPVVVILVEDTSAMATEHHLTLARSQKPVEITLKADSVNKVIEIASRTSPVIWLNLIFFWPLLIVDGLSPKAYTYPHRIYVNMQKRGSGYLTYKVPADDQNNIIKLTPLKIAGLVHPAVELSLERRTGRSFSSSVMFSKLLPGSIFNVEKTLNSQTKGFRAAIEERWYFKKSAPANQYLAAEVDYLKNRYTAVATFTDGHADPQFPWIHNYLDTIGVNKHTLGFAVKFGYQKIINRFTIDYYVGLGARFRDARHTGRINPDDLMARPRHPNIWYETNREGAYWTTHFPMNIKLGWLF